MAATRDAAASHLAMQRPDQRPEDQRQLFLRTTARAADPAPMPPVAVIVAHPDDESLAIGARMSRFTQAIFIHITDGAPADGQDAAAHGFPSVASYRHARETELQNALRCGGIQSPHLQTLNVPDQQAALHLAEITHKLARLLREIAPEAVLTHPYEGGHPDHDACAFAVHHAVAINRSLGLSAPLILEAPFYHATGTGIEYSTFLPHPEAALERSDLLTASERALKAEILACFTSQRETLKYFPLDRESFRLAPPYNFSVPPSSGLWLYDRFQWGVNGHQFLKFAARAQAELSRELSPCR